MRIKLTSTTFWVTVAMAAGAWLAAMADILPPSWAAVLATASVIAYAISRGLAKWGTDMKGGLRTTEFWIACAQVMVIVLAAIPGAVAGRISFVLVATIAAVYAVSRGAASAEATLRQKPVYVTANQLRDAVEEAAARVKRTARARPL